MVDTEFPTLGERGVLPPRAQAYAGLALETIFLSALLLLAAATLFFLKKK